MPTEKFGKRLPTIFELFSFAISGCKFSRLLESTWGKTHSTGEVLGILLALNVHLVLKCLGKVNQETGRYVIKIPLQITFKNMAPSEVIEAHVREAAQKLDLFYDEIMGCRVLVEAPHQHHRRGKLYHVRIDLTVPGGEFVIKRAPRLITERPLRYQKVPDDLELAESRESSKYAAHDDIQLAVRDAFDAARRKLQDYARRRRGVLKVHEGSPHARVSKLFPEEGFGFLETPDGREIYFHENSVLDSGFSGLKIGTEVHFVEELGEKGPQASTVTPVKHHGR